jgi:hypothetical protein
LILFFFLVFCGDFANLYFEIKVRSLYRQTGNDFNMKYYKADFYFPNIYDLALAYGKSITLGKRRNNMEGLEKK